MVGKAVKMDNLFGGNMNDVLELHWEYLESYEGE